MTMEFANASPEPASKPWLALTALLSVALAIAVAWVDYLPTNDGPQHIFAAYLQSHLDDAGRGWNRYLVHGTLVTGSGIVWPLQLLDRVLPWRMAFRVTITGLALFWSWSVLALAAALGPRRRWLGLLGFAAALQWQFYMGLFSFYFATAIGFLVLAIGFRCQLDRLRNLLLLAVLLTLQAVMHIVPAAMTGLVLMLYAALWPAPASRARVLARMAVACLPASLIGALAWLMADGDLNHYSTSLPFTQRIALLGRAFVSGPAWRAWPLTVLALTAGVMAFVRWRQLRDSRLRALALAGTMLVALALATPLHVVGWEYFSVRFIPDAIVFLALLVPVERVRRPGTSRALVATLTLFSLASIGWGLEHHRFLRRQYVDFIAGMAAPLQRQGPRLSLYLEPPPGEAPDEWNRIIPFVATNLHVGPLFSLAQGGVPSSLFAGSGGIHALVYRASPDGLAMPPRPARGYEWTLWLPEARANPARRERALVSMLSYAPTYEDIIFWGTPADHAAIRGRGFRPDFEQGGLMIARFLGCPARIRIVPPAEGLPPTLVLAGWWPDSRLTFSARLAPRAGTQPVEIPITSSPCGPIWVRVLFDMNRDGTQSPGDRTCRGADRNAVLRHDVVSGGDTVLCAAEELVR